MIIRLISTLVNQEIIIRIDASYFRPTEVEELLGDPDHAKKRLGWEPKISLEKLVDEMVNHVVIKG